MPIWRSLERHLTARPFSRALENTGKIIAARMPMIAITTREPRISVKPSLRFIFLFLLMSHPSGVSRTATGLPAFCPSQRIWPRSLGMKSACFKKNQTCT